MTGSVAVRLFAQARIAVGRASLSRPVGPDGLLLSELLSELSKEHPRLRAVLKSCRYVQNGEFVDRGDPLLVAGDEVAIHPPYSGG